MSRDAQSAAELRLRPPSAAVLQEVAADQLDALFARSACADAPGFAVGVAVDGRPLYRRAFGLANADLPVPIATDMRMRVGSVSKHMTALGYLLLCEAGRASLDATIGEHLPELHPITHGVTMRQLMGHVSGLRDVFEIAWEFSGTDAAISSADLLAIYCDLDTVNDAPGRRWQYNNGGYLILGAIIEAITLCPLEDYLCDALFRPLGMTGTALRRNDRTYMDNSAALHMPVGDGGFARDVLACDIAGEGGVVSTVDDMLRWLANMTDHKVGTARSWTLMTTPLRLSNGVSTNYGLGLIRSRYRGVDIIMHGGGVLGGNAQMLKVPQAGLDVVVIANRHDLSSATLVNQVLDLCLEGLEPPERSGPPPSVGLFHSAATGRVVELTAPEAAGQARAADADPTASASSAAGPIVSIDGFDWPFVAGPNGILLPAVPWSHIPYRIALVEGGAAIDFTDCGAVERLERIVGEAAPDSGPCLGTFASTVAVAEIMLAGDRPRALVRGRFGEVGYDLTPLGSHIWRARSGRDIPWDAILLFEPDHSRFHFSTGRLSRLSFERRPTDRTGSTTGHDHV